jgi:hypothetical protein
MHFHLLTECSQQLHISVPLNLCRDYEGDVKKI